jgi:hypothetical protein
MMRRAARSPHSPAAVQTTNAEPTRCGPKVTLEVARSAAIVADSHLSMSDTFGRGTGCSDETPEAMTDA